MTSADPVRVIADLFAAEGAREYFGEPVIHRPASRPPTQPTRIRIGSAVFGGGAAWPRPRLAGRRFFAGPDLLGPPRPRPDLVCVLRPELVRAGMAFWLRAPPPLPEGRLGRP